MAPSQKDIKSDIQSSNLTVSESDTSTSIPTSSAGASPTITENSSKPHNSQAPGKKSLKEAAKENATQLGDPVSLKAETSDNEPTDQDRGAMGKDGDLAGAPKRDSKL